MHTFRTLLAIVLLSFFATHCAAQNASLIPSHLSSADTRAFREIAREIPNPCAEKALSAYDNLESLLDAGLSCHEAAILSSEITFFLSQNMGSLKITGMLKAEAKAMLSPHVFTLDNRPRLGDPASPVEIVVFSDFECPFCARAAKTVHRVYNARPDAVTVVFKHMPLTSIHPYAASAAVVASYAQTQNRFWEIHDKLFDNQSQLSSSFLKSTLSSLGASLDEIFDPVKGQPYAVPIIEDMKDAEAADVAGTPSFYVNGVAIDGGANDDRLLARVDAEIAAPAPVSQRNVRRQANAAASPYPGFDDEWNTLTPAQRITFEQYTGAVLCPCADINTSLKSCGRAQSCPNALPILTTIAARLRANAPQDAVIAEIEAAVAQARANP